MEARRSSSKFEQAEGGEKKAEGEREREEEEEKERKEREKETEGKSRRAYRRKVAPGTLHRDPGEGEAPEERRRRRRGGRGSGTRSEGKEGCRRRMSGGEKEAAGARRVSGVVGTPKIASRYDDARSGPILDFSQFASSKAAGQYNPGQ